MLTYLIEKLRKVSFDRILFMKELEKARRWLTKEEMSILLKWAGENYPDKLDPIEKHRDRKNPARIIQSNDVK